MMGLRSTPQQLDPLGGVTAEAFTWVYTVGSVAAAVGMSLRHRDEYHHAALLLLAFACFAASAITVLLASAPRRAPFGTRSAVLAYTFSLAAVVFESTAQWGSDGAARSDWAPLVLALLLVVMGSFRPAVELLVVTGVGVVLVGVLTGVNSVASAAEQPPLVYAGLTAGPVLATGLASAAYSATLVRRLQAWREATRGRRQRAVEQLRVRVRDDLRDERLTLVEGEVGPFLRGLLARGATDAADAERARRLGDALRGALVAEADGVWLGDLVDVLDDPHGLAGRMDETQRAALEAACTALAGRHTTASLTGAGAAVRCTLRWERGGRGRVGPEVQAILRAVFPGARVTPERRRLVIEFLPA